VGGPQLTEKAVQFRLQPVTEVSYHFARDKVPANNQQVALSYQQGQTLAALAVRYRWSDIYH
jgi:hypothetical protein